MVRIGTLIGALLLGSVALAEKPASPLTPFQGTWAVVSITNDGKEAPEDAAQRLVLVVKNNERMVKDGDEVKSKATFTVDATKEPKQIEVTVSDGPLAGKTYPGIYEFKGDRLTICLALEGDRPTEFTAKEGSKRLLQVYSKAAATSVKEPDLRVELLARRTADQGTRRKLIEVLRASNGKPEGDALEAFQALAAKAKQIDETNTEFLKETIRKHGWPGYALVGKDGAEAAFILAQHCQDGDLQKECLKLLAEAVKKKDANPTNLAYLTDRSRIAAGEKQVYGTEVEEKYGTLEAAPLEDEKGVDARRKEVGLPPLADYLKQVRADRGYPEKK